MPYIPAAGMPRSVGYNQVECLKHLRALRSGKELHLCGHQCCPDRNQYSYFQRASLSPIHKPIYLDTFFEPAVLPVPERAKQGAGLNMDSAVVPYWGIFAEALELQTEAQRSFVVCLPAELDRLMLPAMGMCVLLKEPLRLRDFPLLQASGQLYSLEYVLLPVQPLPEQPEGC